MDKVFIENLSILTTIGVYDWEKEIKQQLVLDLTMDWDNRLAAAEDDLRHALNYAGVSEAVTQLVQGQPYELIETVAEEVAQLILNQFAAARVEVTVRKPKAVANAGCVGVKIVREWSGA
ncbi:dihydroneopterin aldolase [Celerinatantimonas diazotrophica]|uniref:7,8-dihydroneopterin aldolase n=1 Tax=Celerinatantimonas diazotrophica TaxID=412034 RepID=A0A4R1K2L8_9GAMM|nr:dihydroneopterin aldolase [Celerinatantimonas diazotrophica]TCK58087.1 dihydroneopterin aldolase [Celerinatantimonas diazotrophica]CAG9297841.1 Dihydroneopterin aldolase [Celerinatantimonas diazotrophica]